MGLFDAFRYDGKRAVVVGGATGMGAAVAEVSRTPAPRSSSWTAPRSPSTASRPSTLDLADKASIDAAVDECGGPVHALFSCAGVADGTPGIEKINFIGHRHMIDRLLDERPAAPRARPSA